MKWLCLIALLPAVLGQQVGQQKTEEPLAITWQECSAPGSCSDVQGAVVLDSNWRWTHIVDDYVNCYTGNLWDPEYCPDAATCTGTLHIGHLQAFPPRLFCKIIQHS